MRNLRSRRWPAWAAAVLALASALVSLYWTAGGTALLDTVGGAIEDLARERSPGSLALGGGTVLVKALAGALALALAVARPPASARRRRVLLGANGAASAILCLWAAPTAPAARSASAGPSRRRPMSTGAPCAGTCSSGTSGSSSGASS